MAEGAAAHGSLREVAAAPAVALDDVTIAFRLADGGMYRAVDGASLAVADGEFVAIVGPTGCGKSTLLNVAAGLLAPSSGSVSVYGALLSSINRQAGYLHSHSPEEIMAKMPDEIVGADKALYLAALKNTLPMYSTTGKMDPKGAEAVLAVFSQSVPEVANAKIDLSKTYTNKFVEQAGSAKT